MFGKVKSRKKCKGCQKLFFPKTPWQNFCERNCHARSAYAKRAAILRRARRIVAAQEKAAAQAAKQQAESSLN